MPHLWLRPIRRAMAGVIGTWVLTTGSGVPSGAAPSVIPQRVSSLPPPSQAIAPKPVAQPTEPTVGRATEAARSEPPKHEPIVRGEFVRSRRGEFVLGERPFRFVGANIDPLHGDVNRFRIQDLISALAEDGLTVARIWALGEGMEDADDWLRKFQLFRAGPYGFIEDSYLLLDRVLAIARLHGIRVMLTLSNNWSDYGGAPMYLRWTGAASWGLHQEGFYSHPRTREFFRAGLLKLLMRRNTLTGVMYVDDPTIFAWELMNESQIFSEAGQRARIAWIREMAALIREYDKNHMISAGAFGYALRRERADWLRIQQLPDVDFCDSHIYPESLEGFANGRGEKRIWDLLDDRAALCRHVVKKPLVIGEFGFHTDGNQLLHGRPRASWFSRFFRQHFRNRGSGALVWLYEPYQLWGDKVRDFGIHIDHPGTGDVRRVMSTTADQLRRGGFDAFGPDNPRVASAQNAGLQTQLLYDPIVVKAGPASTPHASWSRPDRETALLTIPPTAYARSAWEREGSWTGGKASHVYGADSGDFIYRFRAPALVPSDVVLSIELELRISSEWPVTPAPKNGGSQIHVLIDGAPVGTIAAPADDGSGERRRLLLTDPALRLRLSQGIHTLQLRVPESPQARGLCIYGDYRDEEPPPAGEFTPILLRYRLQSGIYAPRTTSRTLEAPQGVKHP